MSRLKRLCDAGFQFRGYRFDESEWNSTSSTAWEPPLPEYVLHVEFPRGGTTTPENRSDLEQLNLWLRNVTAPGHAGANASAECLVVARAQNVHLNDSNLDDRGLAVLAVSPSLKTLDVTGSRVTQAGVDEFREALPRCKLISDFGVFEARRREDRIPQKSAVDAVADE